MDKALEWWNFGHTPSLSTNTVNPDSDSDKPKVKKDKKLLGKAVDLATGFWGKSKEKDKKEVDNPNDEESSHSQEYTNQDSERKRPRRIDVTATPHLDRRGKGPNVSPTSDNPLKQSNGESQKSDQQSPFVTPKKRDDDSFASEGSEDKKNTPKRPKLQDLMTKPNNALG